MRAAKEMPIALLSLNKLAILKYRAHSHHYFWTRAPIIFYDTFQYLVVFPHFFWIFSPSSNVAQTLGSAFEVFDVIRTRGKLARNCCFFSVDRRSILSMDLRELCILS